MHDDGRNGARARASRIRAAHDYDDTHLAEMRRRGVPERTTMTAHALSFLRRWRQREQEMIEHIEEVIEEAVHPTEPVMVVESPRAVTPDPD